MRHPYTPIFRDLLTSSLWVTDPATRCAWIWMLLSADPEGFVCSTLPGLAHGANISLEEAQKAIALFEAPDPFSATKELEGRRVVAVERGWHIVNFVARRDLAKHEAEKARKRKWAAENRPSRGKQLELPFCGEPSKVNPEVDAPKPKPKHSSSEGGGSPLPPIRSDFVDGSFSTEPAPTLPAVIHKLGDWHPSADELATLRADAVIAGVPDFDDRLAALAEGPVGGKRGLLPDKVAGYIRRQFPTWKTWRETDQAAKANSRAAAGAPRRFAGGGGGWEPNDAHKRFAEHYGLDLPAMVDAYRRSGEPEQRGGGKDADDAFTKRLVKAKRDRSGRAA